MTIYLHDVPLPDALQRLKEALEAAGLWGISGIEDTALDEHILGRILAEPVWARISSPHYHASAMDGFAIRSVDTEGALPARPVTLSVPEGAILVDTGDPLPAWADAVVPIENVEALDNSSALAVDPRRPAYIRLRASVTPWSHVRVMGEDIVATQLVLPAGHRLRPVDLGAIAAAGHDRVSLSRQPRVAIIPTGSELVPIGQPLRTGEIIEFNSVMLAAQVNSWGGSANRLPIIPDRFEGIRQTVLEAAREHDLVLLNAGSSAGSEDFSAQVVQELGELLVHGVAVRPGHPVILGMISVERKGSPAKVPIIGVPGYPVSAVMTGEIFVRPLLERWLGLAQDEPVTVSAYLTRKITSPAGDDDYVRIALGRVGGRLLAAPLSRGAGVISSLSRADGIAIIPRGVQGLAAGDQVNVRLFRSLTEIDRTILAIGSHDIVLDLIAQFLSLYDRRLSSANVGSLAGLVALRRGEAHLAGSHLLDPESGEYNLPYVRQYLEAIPVKILTLVGRQQGLLVRKGNHKGIQSLRDLVREDVTFVNRQRGSGTRLLLDYHLEMLGIAPQDIRGYTQEEYTHLAIAVAVFSGRADCGLGIAAAAQATDLDFVPLFQERYDLVIPREHDQGLLLQPLYKVLENAEFRRTVASMPGYDITHMGEVVAITG